MHKDEYVISADATRRVGRAFLNRINGRGYADGGYVTAPARSVAANDSGSYRAQRPLEQHFHFSVPVDRRTQSQVGAEAYRGSRLAAHRLG